MLRNFLVPLFRNLHTILFSQIALFRKPAENSPRLKIVTFCRVIRFSLIFSRRNSMPFEITAIIWIAGG